MYPLSLFGPYKHDKLHPKSIPFVFLGYSSHSNGYYCLDPKTGRIYSSGHVVFHESSFPFEAIESTSSTLDTHQQWVNLPIPIPNSSFNASTTLLSSFSLTIFISISAQFLYHIQLYPLHSQVSHPTLYLIPPCLSQKHPYSLLH